MNSALRDYIRGWHITSTWQDSGRATQPLIDAIWRLDASEDASELMRLAT